MSEDQEKAAPEADLKQQDEDDVEAHGVKPDAELAATEEGPDVEGHAFKTGVKPSVKP